MWQVLDVPIDIAGPADVRRVSQQLDWLRLRLIHDHEAHDLRRAYAALPIVSDMLALCDALDAARAEVEPQQRRRAAGAGMRVSGGDAPHDEVELLDRAGRGGGHGLGRGAQAIERLSAMK